jgi:aspartate kinase
VKVCKFGGTSLADAEAVRKVCGIVTADRDRRIVVVSAPGKRNSADTKVTDLLIQCAERRLAGHSPEQPLRAVVQRFRDIYEGLGLPASLGDEVDKDLRRRLEADPAHRARFVDGLKAAGEDHCARLLAAELRHLGFAARYTDPKEAGLFLTSEYGNAQILPESYDNLARLRAAEGIVVFPGFFGYTREGEVVTFPRGGSDISGSVLAAAVTADLYENFTDVSSVYAADPRIVPEAQPIPELTYREMRELAYAGFAVFHDEAVVPAVLKGIPICIKNTHCPEAPGTRISAQRAFTPGDVAGIASAPGFCMIFLSKYLMNREVGFGRRLLQILEEESLSFEHMPSGIDNLSVILREEAFESATEARVVGRIRSELQVADVEVERGLALIMIVGEGMRYAVGEAARATRAMAEAGVNIEMMNQGSSEISMMFGVKARDRDRALRSLYREFFGSRRPASGTAGAGRTGEP